MSDTTKPTLPSQYQLRAELESYVLGDLLVPGGRRERGAQPERTVRDRYLVGVLALSRAANAAAKPAVDEEEAYRTDHLEGRCRGWREHHRQAHRPAPRRR
jgi:hypothetical protein